MIISMNLNKKSKIKYCIWEKYHSFFDHIIYYVKIIFSEILKKYNRKAIKYK